jgi:hypothetical protein
LASCERFPSFRGNFKKENSKIAEPIHPSTFDQWHETTKVTNPRLASPNQPLPSDDDMAEAIESEDDGGSVVEDDCGGSDDFYNESEDDYVQEDPVGLTKLSLLMNRLASDKTYVQDKDFIDNAKHNRPDVNEMEANVAQPKRVSKKKKRKKCIYVDDQAIDDDHDHSNQSSDSSDDMDELALNQQSTSKDINVAIDNPIACPQNDNCSSDSSLQHTKKKRKMSKKSKDSEHSVVASLKSTEPQLLVDVPPKSNESVTSIDMPLLQVETDYMTDSSVSVHTDSSNKNSTLQQRPYGKRKRTQQILSSSSSSSDDNRIATTSNPSPLASKNKRTFESSTEDSGDDFSDHSPHRWRKNEALGTVDSIPRDYDGPAPGNKTRMDALERHRLENSPSPIRRIRYPQDVEYFSHSDPLCKHTRVHRPSYVQQLDGECHTYPDYEVVPHQDRTLNNLITFFAREKFRDYVFTAMYGSGFDFLHIMAHCIKRGVRVRHISNGNKIVGFTITAFNVRFVDIFLYVPSGLRSLKKSFSLKTGSKGFFPHMLNQSELNRLYVFQF